MSFAGVKEIRWGNAKRQREMREFLEMAIRDAERQLVSAKVQVRRCQETLRFFKRELEDYPPPLDKACYGGAK